jgi:uncharacterized membrane protein
MRPNMPLILALVALLIAAVLQEMIPVTARMPVKGFFLTGVAIYHVLDKPKLMSFVILLWAGMLTDALGRLPHGFTVIFLSLIYPLLLLVKRMVAETTILQGILWGSVISALQQIWLCGWIHKAGVAVFSLDMLKLASAAAVMGAVAGFLMFLLCSWLERYKGVDDRKATEVEGLNGIL